MHVLVAGCGWLGTALGRALCARGDRVTGIRRDPGRAAALRAAGIEPLPLDLSAPGAPGHLPSDLDAIVACQSSGADTEAAYRSAYVEANRTLLAHAARRPLRAFVYTGSTGVFGQRDGGDVDERTPTAPSGPTASVLVEAERLVLSAAGRGTPASIVRLSGLYGPGRAGLADRVRTGRLALGPGDEAWMNFCHLDDAVTFVLAALDRGRPGAVYHGSDAHPARRREVVTWIAARLGMEPPRGEAPPAGPDRRILSASTRAELDVALAWPTFREGFAAILPAPAAGP
ncbi:MAG TPA: NAD-dependent epimerase/dehydratase family protein [Anaeromyxobacteraceae bacterium]|nr:NAD-dependent epimerase/dehydratase family protein [Anaeromyxobacteraceae bacterium]